MSHPSIGTVLRHARKIKKVSLHEASWETRIRVDFLEKMEQDNFRFMIGPAYIRGLLRSYSAFLDLDESAMVAYFDEVHGPPVEASVVKISKLPRGPRFRFQVNWMMAAVGAALVLLLLSFIGLMEPVGQGDVAEAPESSDVAGDLGIPTPAALAGAQTEVTVEVVGEKAWLLVVADGNEAAPVFEGTLPAGVRQTFTANKELKILFADLGSVRVTVNGRDLGVPGQPGEVGNFIFRSDTSDFVRE